MQILLHSLMHFTLSDGGEFVTLIPSKSLEISEGDSIEVVSGGSLIFDGNVSHEWTNDVGIQIIQAVITSVMSCGVELSRAGRVLTEVRFLLEGLNSYERGYLLERLNDGLKRT